MIGILGGTFDPIHFGHLRPALDIQQALELEEVRMLPSKAPPHRDMPYATPDQRLTMLRLAVHGERALSVDERELQRDGKSYMVDTLLSFRAEMGQERPLALLIGMDALQGLDRWHRWQELTELCHLVVATRPGWKPPHSGKVASLVKKREVTQAADLRMEPAGKILFCPVTPLDISASRIRALVAEGKSPRYLLPTTVLEYIQLAGLYKQ